MSRNTVRKVLRSGETSFEYERVVQPRPKLGRWAAELDGLLAGNAAKSAREQLTLIRIFEELRGRGYDGGYDAVRRYARRWSKERGESTAAAYVPLSFAPGEAYQFDWSHEVVLLNGVTVIVKAAHVRLCHSRMLFVRCYPRETQEMVFDAHDRHLRRFKGTCVRGIYDNMKTAGRRSSSVKGVSTIAASCRCAAITWSIRLPARRRRAGRRAVGEPSGLSVNASSRRGCGSNPRRVERVAAGQVHRLRQGAPASRTSAEQTVWEVFAAERPKPVPAPAGSTDSTWCCIGLEDLPGAVRQQ